MQRSFEEIIHIPFVSQLLLLPKGIISSDAELQLINSGFFRTFPENHKE